jgi:transcriptional regulator
MYQPDHGRFAVPDPAASLAELAAVVPATLVTMTGGGFAATVLPMLYDPDDGQLGTLRGHLARQNPQWRELPDDIGALAIFSGPDAYVSPTLYETKGRTGRDVPTWDYVTVHVHGVVVVREDPAWLLAVVRGLSDRHEAGRTDQWSVDDAPAGYIEGQLRAIVGVELRVSRLEAKRKLSQNRDPADVAGVIAAFSDGTPGERAVAAEMRRKPPA